MADTARLIPPSSGSRALLNMWGRGVGAGAGLVAAGIALHLLRPERVVEIQNFALIFGALLVEAFPFILLGAVVASAIEVFVPSGVIAGMARLPRGLQLPAAGMAGFAFPVCECGSVPVARRLAAKGLSPGAAVTFMLAAPILNPIVIISTIVAFRGRESMWPIVLGRTTLGLIASMAVGWVVGRMGTDELLRAAPRDDRHDIHEAVPAGAAVTDETDGADPHAVASRSHGSAHVAEPRWKEYFGHVGDDFLFMGRYLVLGAAVAAGLQTFVPQSVIGSVAGIPVIDLLAMMALAFVLSLCSESDAFVAASFVQFGVGAQLAFLVFGPMVDTKLGFLYSGTYGIRFFRTVVIVVTAVTLAGTLWLQVLFG